MKNILLKGSPGTGKTFLSRAAAFYICNEKLKMEDVFAKDIHSDKNEIEEFIDSERCEFIQVHPAMSYEDIVYGIEIKASVGMTISYAEKRIKKLCKRAAGKTDLYCIIFDDIGRVDAGTLLGNLLYAMEYRNQPIDLADGQTLSIPENVMMIFTVCNDLYGTKLDYALCRRMDYVKDLVPDKTILDKYYDEIVSSKAKEIIIAAFDSVCDFIIRNIMPDYGMQVNDYIPGHGMFMIERMGTTYLILDRVKQKLLYQVHPHLVSLRSNGIINGDIESFFSTIESTINTGIASLNNITDIQKIMVNLGETVAPYSLSDTKDYYKTEIIPGHCSDYKGILESVIDAIVLNGVFPYDIATASLLMNVDIASVPSKTSPVTYAAYLVKKQEAGDFYYESARKGKTRARHAYYSTNTGKVGRWVAKKDVAAYQFSYTDGTQEEIYLPLNGLRVHTFTNENVCKVDNPAEIYGSAYRLIQYYLKIFEQNISLIKGTEPAYIDLDNLILLEIKYLQATNNELKNISGPTQTQREKARIEFFGSKLMVLQTLWSAKGDNICVDEQKYNDLVSGKAPFSLDAYEDMYVYTPGTKKTIELRGVVKMTDLKDYQKIMENIGVRQMIFQGPPGTSKTFESKKFVLQQLEPTSTAFTKTFISQEDISTGLEQYKLTDNDYTNPGSSSKLTTGGWDLVQFHPSYGYEDFIRGIEVKTLGGMPSYNTVNRIFGKIAEFAKIAEKSTPANPPKFYLVIDEINRANLATVFGELIYGLEYRDSKVSTPYEVEDKECGVVGATTKDIVLGKNLFIIGTMNTADKSIDAIDYAIRRRFIFVDSPADRNVVISCYQNVSGKKDEDSIELLLFDAVQAVFENTSYFNEEYQKSDVKLGHTYFLRKRAAGYEEDIVEHFVFQIVPILREYLKDGILDAIEDLVSMEHTPAEIKAAPDWKNQVQLLSDNVMLFVKEFGNISRFGQDIDNKYVGKFIEDLRIKFKY
ncbi:AAA family ATPase [Clostridium gasigenes]|uniref:AAA family ATPase n=1 Tax=Clostridium gasigenes TaxID=94869 RepID=UPI001C0CBB74|nr:AAA family ATPase [Clostridium gasigenes]MBU3134400.1 AAA family ATPase [Clostridium gasigenes]